MDFSCYNHGFFQCSNAFLGGYVFKIMLLCVHFWEVMFQIHAAMSSFLGVCVSNSCSYESIVGRLCVQIHATMCSFVGGYVCKFMQL